MFGLRPIVKLFDNNSVSICGKKGRGKDLLMSNVVARRKSKYYISNVDYHCKNKQFIRFSGEKLSTGNTYADFLNDTCKQYIYPYPDGTDIYLSDCGIYFPSQYCGELNRDYRDIPVFMALSRQLGDCYVHTNAQALNRVWDKIREQSDTYIDCRGCKVLNLFGLKIVFQRIRIYERYDSAVAGVPPCRIRIPVFGSQAKSNAKIERERYAVAYGDVKSRLLIYLHRTKYDTRVFKSILERCENEV
jgi:hypothetical protein